MSTYVPWPLHPLAWGARQWVAVAFAIFFLYSAGVYHKRTVIFQGNVIRENIWFHWRQHELPPRVKVFRDIADWVVVADADNGQVLVALAREFGKASAVQASIRAWLRKEHRLAEVA